MREHRATMPDYCVIEAAMEVVGGKWKLAIMKQLFGGPKRFGELCRAMPTITPRMLTRQLRELEADGLVLRTVHPRVPLKVEYTPTALGGSLEPIASQLESWGHRYRPNTERVGPAAVGSPASEEGPRGPSQNSAR